MSGLNRSTKQGTARAQMAPGVAQHGKLFVGRDEVHEGVARAEGERKILARQVEAAQVVLHQGGAIDQLVLHQLVCRAVHQRAADVDPGDGVAGRRQRNQHAAGAAPQFEQRVAALGSEHGDGFDVVLVVAIVVVVEARKAVEDLV